MDGQQVSLGVTDPNDESGAWEALKKIVAGAVREAIAPAAGVKPGSVKELAGAFLESKGAEVKARTLRGYGQHLAWLVKHWGYLRLAELTTAAVRSAADAETWSDTHRANVLWTVNGLFRWSGRSDKLALPQKESRGAEAVIPDAVHRRVLSEVKGDFRALVQFLWLTGCRPGEATGLSAEAVNWEAKAVKIRQHKTKHKGKTRTLFLPAEAVELLREQAEKYKGAGHLFRGTRGRPFSLQAMTMRFERVSEKVGHKVTSYMYRHTYATRALAAGESDAVVAAILGHSSTAMIHKHYSHISEQGRALKDAAERIAKR